MLSKRSRARTCQALLKHKKNDIVAMCTKWKEYADDNTKHEFTHVFGSKLNNDGGIPFRAKMIEVCHLIVGERKTPKIRIVCLVFLAAG